MPKYKVFWEHHHKVYCAGILTVEASHPDQAEEMARDELCELTTEQLIEKGESDPDYLWDINTHIEEGDHDD